MTIDSCFLNKKADPNQPFSKLKNIKRSLLKPFVGLTKGVAYSPNDNNDIMLAIVAPELMLIQPAIGGGYGLIHGTCGAVNSTRKGVANLLNLR